MLFDRCYSYEELFSFECALCTYKLNLPSLFISHSFQVSATDDLRRVNNERGERFSKDLLSSAAVISLGLLFFVTKEGKQQLSLCFSIQTPTQTVFTSA